MKASGRRSGSSSSSHSIGVDTGAHAAARGLYGATRVLFTAFCVMWAAATLLAYVLYRVELAGKRTDVNLRELREALS